MPHAPTDTRPTPRGRPRKITSAVALTLAILGGLVAVAPSALAYHPEPTAQVACVEDQILLDWTTVSWGGPELWGPDFYNEDVRVYLQYGTDDAEIGGLTDEEIAQGAFDEDSLSFSGQTALTPPDGATRVRVHSEALAPWASGDVSIPDPLQTTPWLDLPGQCGEEEPPPPPPPVEVEVGATTSYDCDARTTVVVTVTSTGGASTFEIRVDDVPTTTLTDVTGSQTVEVTIPADGTSTLVVLVGEDVVLTESINPVDCPEVGGVVTQPTPPTVPTAPAPTQTVDPTVAAQTLPRTGVSTAMVVAVGLALLGLGAAALTAERRAATVEVDRTDRSA